MTRHTYYVETWDMDKQRFTPQPGVRKGPYSLWGLKRALKKLRNLGYQAHRQDPFVSVWREERP